MPSRSIFRGFVAESVLESADSSPESAVSTTDSMLVGRLSVNMFNIDENRWTVGRLQNVLVGMGLYILRFSKKHLK